VTVRVLGNSPILGSEVGGRDRVAAHEESADVCQQRMWWKANGAWADTMWVSPDVAYTFVCTERHCQFTQQPSGLIVDWDYSNSSAPPRFRGPGGRLHHFLRKPPSAHEHRMACLSFGLNLDVHVWSFARDVVPPEGRSGGMGLRGIRFDDRDLQTGVVTVVNMLPGLDRADEVWADVDESLGIIRYLACRDEGRDLAHAFVEDVVAGDHAMHDIPAIVQQRPTDGRRDAARQRRRRAPASAQR
jgi:hypothetical protein